MTTSALCCAFGCPRAFSSDGGHSASRKLLHPRDRWVEARLQGGGPLPTERHVFGSLK